MEKNGKTPETKIEPKNPKNAVNAGTLPEKPVLNGDGTPLTTGKYKISEVLGKGAMGIVYKGFDPHIERIVAIKRIRKENLQDQDLDTVMERFRREAKAAGRLHHPNIVTVHEYGEDDKDAYIVMEFVEGLSLREYLKQKKCLSAQESVDIMTKLLSALDYSHREGVVHRDIKPGNVFILGNGDIKLSDFGIAKFDESDLTQTGMVIGTPAYMSPEQIKGLKIDSRSDLFSAGIILYEMLTGQRPFTGDRIITIMNNVIRSSYEDPRIINPDIPRVFKDVIQKALAKDPEERFQSASEFSKSIEHALEKTAPEELTKTALAKSPEKSPQANKGPLLAGLVVFLIAALAGAGIWMWSKSNGTQLDKDKPSVSEQTSPASEKDTGPTAASDEKEMQKQTHPPSSEMDKDQQITEKPSESESAEEGKEVPPEIETDKPSPEDLPKADVEKASSDAPAAESDEGKISREMPSEDEKPAEMDEKAAETGDKTAEPGPSTISEPDEKETELKEDTTTPEKISETDKIPALDKTVMVSTDPAGAEVYIDGELYGNTPLTFFISSGEHRVEIKKDGYMGIEDSISMESDETQPLEYTATLEPEQPEAGTVPQKRRSEKYEKAWQRF